MTDRRLLIHAIFMLLAPVLVAWFGLSVLSATLLVLLLVAWRWAIVMSGWVMPEKTPDLVLQTISISHYVEKVRWCMDRLALEYVEKPSAGTLGAYYRGFTVPRLLAKTGSVRSSIGNSTEILRYLWGRYGYPDPAAAAFLEPTNERVELEERLNRHGANLQVWVYYRILDERDLTLHAWGVANPAIPGWQRQLMKLLYPVQAWLIRKSFRINDEHFARAVAHIEDLLADMNTLLMDERVSLLGDDTPNYTDFQFAAMVGLWLMPPEYGGGKADTVRTEREVVPEPMRMDIESWEAAYPRVVSFVKHLYATERHT